MAPIRMLLYFWGVEKGYVKYDYKGKGYGTLLLKVFEVQASKLKAVTYRLFLLVQ